MQENQKSMFHKSYITTDDNINQTLAQSANFEQITKGRLGATLVDYNSADPTSLIPLVRTTTSYKNAASCFQPIHYELVSKIKAKFDFVEANNALIEIYNDEYRTMGFHSDQALDLVKESYICVYSCYSDPSKLTEYNVRKLKIREKNADLSTNTEQLSMDHNSIIVFSTSTNRCFQHKIVLDAPTSPNWLGITFRLSKTKIRFVDNVPYFNDTDKTQTKRLVLATKDQEKIFYKCRSLENQHIDYEYSSEIDYTVSVSDLLLPTIIL